ncbi:glycosyltransferase family 39 protein [Candidatus Omnitrophota bacterium]
MIRARRIVASRVNILLVALMFIVLLFSIFIKPKSLETRMILSFDEILYNKMANQIRIDLTDYNGLSFYKYIKRRNPNLTLPGYFTKPLFKHPPMYSLILTLPKRLGFEKPKEANYFSFYVALLLPFLAFFIAWQLFDKRTAFFAFLFLSIEPVYWLCSLRVWMGCTLTLFMYLSILFFILGWKNDKYYILSGVFLGFSLLTKYTGVLVAPIILIFAATYKPELFRNIKFYLIFIIAFLIFMPWIIWNIKVYGNFLSTIMFHKDTSTDILNKDALFMDKLTLLIEKPHYMIFLLLSGLAMYWVAFKGYIARIEQGIRRNEILSVAAVVLFLIFIFSLKDVKQGFIETILLNKLPPISQDYPNPFINEPWSFYIGHFLKMSPIFILSYLGLFFLNSRNEGDKLLLVAVLLIFLFCIIWKGNQSRYALSAIFALTILASRSFFWFWDALGRIREIFFRRLLKSMSICVIFYFFLKTAIVGIKLTTTFGGEGYFTYF